METTVTTRQETLALLDHVVDSEPPKQDATIAIHATLTIKEQTNNDITSRPIF